MRCAHTRSALLCHKIADSLSEAEDLQQQVAALLGASAARRIPEVGDGYCDGDGVWPHRTLI
jgi:hypothetical protein